MGLKKNMTEQVKLGWESFYQQTQPMFINIIAKGCKVDFDVKGKKVDEEEEDIQI